MKVNVKFAVLAAVALGILPSAAMAEVSTVRLAKQLGISYLPLTVMEEQGLLEKHAAEAGHEITVEWLRFTGGSGMNEALISGNLDFASGGVGPLLTIWGRTQTNLGVKGVATLNAMPIQLVSMKEGVGSIADLTETDKIALPAVKTSIQAVTLQMAAEKEFGEGEQHRLDPLTVSMGHTDAQVALMGGGSEITAHFGSSPFQEMELKDERATLVLDSYDVLGGAHTFNSVWASGRFVEANPQITQAFVDALKESMEFIDANPEEAAALWIEAESTNLSQEDAVAIITAETTEWTTTPKKVLDYLAFMNRVGLVEATTENWQDIFFPMIHDEEGS